MKFSKALIPMILVGAGVLFSACTNSPTGEAVKEKKDAMAANGDFKGSMKDLFAHGKTQVCTWSMKDMGTSTVYVDGDKSRIETKSTMPNQEKEVVRSVISDGEFVYSWDDYTKKGIKMSVEEMDEDAEQYTDEMDEMDQETDVEETSDFEEMMAMDYEFECKAWSSDPNMFVVPADVEFQDMNKLVEEMQESMGGMKDMCNMMSGADKEDCLKSFDEAMKE